MPNPSLTQDDITPVTTGHRRTDARLFATQALYQWLLLHEAPADVLAQFVAHRLKGHKIDKPLFSALFESAVAGHERYDTLLKTLLTDKWPLERLGLVEHALLLAAVSELEVRPETPQQVIVSDFLNIARGFFDDSGVHFINAVLDKAAKQMRAF